MVLVPAGKSDDEENSRTKNLFGKGKALKGK
jgi:hypothetical protein